MSFSLFFFMLLSSTYCAVFNRFRVGLSDDKVSIRQNHHIKSCLLVCCKFEIISILSLELFLFCFNPDAVSFAKRFNTFNFVLLRIYY